MKTKKAITRAKIARFYYGLDLNKDFFSLNNEELDLLKKCYNVSGYNGRNNLGRSKLRQFWYHLQWGWEKMSNIEKDAH